MRKSYIFLLAVFIAMCIPSTFSQIPLYEEGFESPHGGLPSEWTQDPSTGTNKWAVQTSGFINPYEPNSGAGLVKFTTVQNGTPNSVMLISPQIDNRSLGENAVLSFAYSAFAIAGRTDSLKVYYRLRETQQWQPLGSYGVSTQWKTVSIDLPNTGQFFQLGFEGISSEAHGVALDDVKITKKPNCQIPTNIQVYNIIHDSVKIRWSGSGEPTYTVKLSTTPLTDPANENGIHMWSEVGRLNTGFSGLIPDRVYYYYINADCGWGDISSWVSGTFKTACEPYLFEGNDFEGGYDVAMNCWTDSVEGRFVFHHTDGYDFDLPVPRPITSRTDVATSASPIYEVVGEEEVMVGYDIRTDSRTPTPNSGSGALMINMLTQESNQQWSKVWVTSPRLPDNVKIQDKQLEFYVRAHNNKLKLRVLVSEWPDEYGDAETAGVVSCKTSSTYEKFVITFDKVKMDAKYITFFVDGSGEDISTSNGGVQWPNITIDDVKLKDLEICDENTKISVFGDPITGTDTAKLSWNSNTAEKWEIKISAVSINPNVQGDATTVSEPEIIARLLDAGTTYYYYVKAICEEGVEGAWSDEQTFQTICPPDGFIPPYRHNFDNVPTGGFPNCWSYLAEGGSGRPTVTSPGSGTAYSKPNVLSYYSGVFPMIFISPKINGDLTKMQVSFQLATIYGVGTPVEVGIMRDPLDETSFTLIKTIYGEINSGFELNWHDITVNLSTDKEDVGQYVAIRFVRGSSFAIDDFIIEDLPACGTPENIRVTETTTQSITVDWTPTGLEEEWNIAIGTEKFTLSGTTPYITTKQHPFPITNLDENVVYDIYIRSSCGPNEKGQWVGPFTAKTQSPHTIPFECDFEDDAESNAWIYQNGNQLNQWVAGSAVAYEGARSLYISADYGDNNTHVSTSGSYNYVYRTLVLEQKVYDFEFYYRSQGTAQSLSAFLVPADYIIEGGQSYHGASSTMTQHLVPDGWIEITDRALYSTPNWSKWENTIQIEEPGNYNLVFYWKSYYSSGVSSSVDNVSVKLSSACLTPEKLHIYNVKQETADLSFFSLNAPSWKLVVSSDELTEAQRESAVVGTNGVAYVQEITESDGVTITGLSPDVTYYAYLRSTCTENSGWASTSFTTICLPIDVPVSENFDDGNYIYLGSDFNGSLYFVECWRQLSTANTRAEIMKRSYEYGNNLTRSLKIPYSSGDYSLVILPEMETDIDHLQMSFKLMNPQPYSSHPFALEIGVMEDASNINDFHKVATLRPKVAEQWKTFVVLLDEYKGQGVGKHIAFRTIFEGSGMYSGNLFIDDLVIDSIKGCVSPREITISNQTTTSADFEWRIIGDPGTYHMKICSSPQTRWEDEGDIYNNDEIKDNSISLNGIFYPATTYYVYVRTVCDEDDDTEYSFAYSELIFTTDCGGFKNLPYIDNFDDYELKILPPCWTVVEEPVGGGIFVSAPNWTDMSGTVKPIGAASLEIGSSQNFEAIVAMPQFTEDIKSLSLSFQALQVSSSDQLEVGFITNVDDKETFTTLETLNLDQNYQWLPVEINFESATAGSRIAFRLPRATGMISGKSFYIDEISVRSKSVTCDDVPTVVVTKVTETTANVAWSGTNPTGYEIMVSSKIIDPTTENGNVLPAAFESNVYRDLDELSPNTRYYVYVRTVCNNNQYGYWSEPVAFTTMCGDPELLPYYEDFDGFGDIEDVGFFPSCWRYRVQIIGDLPKGDQITPYIDIEEYSMYMEANFDVKDSGYAVVDVITPKLAVDESLTQYQMTFKMRSSLSNGVMYVGTVSDPSSGVITPYDTVYATSTANQWNIHMVNLLHVDMKDNPQHIGFRINSLDTDYNAYSVQIDSIVIRELEPCMPPYKARIDSRPATKMGTIEYTKAFVSWLPGDANTSEWEYYYSVNPMTIPFTNEEFEEVNESEDYGFVVITPVHGSGILNEPSFTINAQTDEENWWEEPVSTLYVYIKNTCDDLFYPEALVYRKQSCGNISLPYNETFTNYKYYNLGIDEPQYSAYPDCWVREDSNTADDTAYPYIDEDYRLYFYSEPGEIVKAELPLMASTYGIKENQVRFSAMSETSSSIQVGVKAYYYDGTLDRWISDYELLETIELTPTLTEYTVEFADYDKEFPNASTYYGVSYTCYLGVGSDEESKVKIDELNLEATPYCLTPEVEVLSVTETGIRLFISQEENENNFQVAFGPSGIDVKDLPKYDSDEEFSQLNLTPNTHYSIFVQSRCTNGLESEWNELHLVTLQEAAEFPYSTDFTADEGSNWTLLNGNSKNQWVIGSAAGGTSLYVSNDEGTSHDYTETEHSSIYAYRTIEVPAGPQKLTFDWKAMGEAGKDYLRVFLVPQSVEFTAGKIEGLDANSVPKGWIPAGGEHSGKAGWTSEEYHLYVSHLNKEPLNLLFYWTNNDDLSDGIPAAVRNVDLDKSSMCTTPEFLSAYQITDNTAMVDWISYNANSWELKLFRQPQDNPGTAPGAVNEFPGTNPYLLTTLDADTEYYFYIKSECNDIWSEAGHFRTACAPDNVLFEEFNDATLPECWDLYEGLASEVFADPANLRSTTEGWTINLENTEDIFGSPNAKLTIDGDNTAHWLISPAIILNDSSALSFNLALTAYGTSAPVYNETGQKDDQFMVLISDDQGLTWKEQNATIWNNKDDGARSFNKISHISSRIDVDLFDYTEKTIRVAFYGESTVDLESNDMHIDSVRIDCRIKKYLEPVRMCSGYPYYANGFSISEEENSTPGEFIHTRVEYSKTGGCDTTVVLKLIVRESYGIHRTHTLCTDKEYIDKDFSISGADLKPGTYSKIDSVVHVSSTGCDSIIWLNLIVSQAYDIKETINLTSDELPFPYGCEGEEIPKGASSMVKVVQCKTQADCDSIVTLTVIIDGKPVGTGIDEIYSESLSFIPNPTSNGERVDINYAFTAEEREGLTVEVFNNSGIKISTEQPDTYPVSVKAPVVSGIYMIRVTTGNGKVMIGKLIVN